MLGLLASLKILRSKCRKRTRWRIDPSIVPRPLKINLCDLSCPDSAPHRTAKPQSDPLRIYGLLVILLWEPGPASSLILTGLARVSGSCPSTKLALTSLFQVAILLLT
jgi:hypothetical protein